MSKNMDVMKQQFLRRYNTQRSADRALRAGIQAAVQRNPTYRAGLSRQHRDEVRQAWLVLLGDTLSRYVRPTTASTYEADIECLAEEMNDSFARSHLMGERHPRYGYDPGFRISHAQKSLGVALKHLWCLGEAALPPQCPIDSVVLRRAGLSYPDTRWAYANSIEHHGAKIAALTAAASGEPLAEWELRQFAG